MDKPIAINGKRFFEILEPVIRFTTNLSTVQCCMNRTGAFTAFIDRTRNRNRKPACGSQANICTGQIDLTPSRIHCGQLKLYPKSNVMPAVVVQIVALITLFGHHLLCPSCLPSSHACIFNINVAKISSNRIAERKVNVSGMALVSLPRM